MEHAAQECAEAGACSLAGSMCVEGAAQEPCSQPGLDGIAQGELMFADLGAAHSGAERLALSTTPEHGDIISDHDPQSGLPDTRTAGVSSCEACTVEPPLQPPPAMSTQERAVFDMSPEWQRALQSLAAVPGLNVFAKRLTRCNAQ